MNDSQKNAVIITLKNLVANLGELLVGLPQDSYSNALTILRSSADGIMKSIIAGNETLFGAPLGSEFDETVGLVDDYAAENLRLKQNIKESLETIETLTRARDAALEEAADFKTKWEEILRRDEDSARLNTDSKLNQILDLLDKRLPKG